MKGQAVFILCITVLSFYLASVNALESEDLFTNVSAWFTKSDFEATGMFENGSLKYFISNGTCSPGQKIRIQWTASANDTKFKGLLTVFKLLEIQENGNLTEIERFGDNQISSATWKSNLPYRDNSTYRLGVVIWRSNPVNRTYEVVGRLMSTLIIPSLPWFKFNVTMLTDYPFYSSIQPISITIKNYGTRISFGEPYSIERYENGKWEKIPTYRSGWILILHVLDTNETFHQLVTIPFEIWTPGHYRVVKEIDSKILTAEFYIVDSPLIYIIIATILSVLIIWRLRKRNRAIAS